MSGIIELSQSLSAASPDDVTPEVVVVPESNNDRTRHGSISKGKESKRSRRARTKAKSAINADRSANKSGNNLPESNNRTTAAAKINPGPGNRASNTPKTTDSSKPATLGTIHNASGISRSGDNKRTSNPVRSSSLPDLSLSQSNNFLDPQKTYYGRLCNLIICEGTKVLQRYVKDNIDQRISLQDLLQIPKIQKLFCSLKKSHRILSHQYKMLYPDDGSPLKEENVDISLWVVLARNLVKDRNMIDWDRTPRPDEDLLPHHVLRYGN